MSLLCTRCSGTGFLDLEQMPVDFFSLPDPVTDTLAWMAANEGHDVSVCDCCGDGESWHGDEPGQHTMHWNGHRHVYDGGVPECV